MYLTVGLGGHGFHPAAWRVSAATAAFDLGLQRDLLVKAEQAGVEAALLGLSVGGPATFSSGLADACALDALPLLGGLGPATHRIGLGATVALSRTQPFHTARAFSVLDHLTGGRTAWVIPPRHEDEGAFMDDAAYPALSRDEWYARAAEYIAVVTKLWDSWQDGCVLADKAAGIFADSRKVHPIAHADTYFSVRGPLTAIRPLQGRPVVIQLDHSPQGLELAARTADLFIGTCASADEAVSLRSALLAQLDAAARPRSELKFLVSISTLIEETESAAKRRAEELDRLVTPPLAAAIARDAERSLPGEASEPRPAHRQGMRFVGTAARLYGLMAEWTDRGVCDGFNIMPSILPDSLSPLLAELAQRRRPAESQPASLRQRLGLPRPAGVFDAATGGMP